MDEIRKEVLQRFRRLQTLLHRYQAQRFMNFGPWSNPYRGQGRILAILKLKSEISQKELSYLLDMSRQGLAELLNKLESSGYITRETSTSDRRSYTIRLTQKGTEAAGKLDDTPFDLDDMFDCLNDRELANLNDYLKRIVEQFEERFPENEDLHKRMAEKFMEHGHRFGKDGFSDFFGRHFPHGWNGRPRGKRDD